MTAAVRQKRDVMVPTRSLSQYLLVFVRPVRPRKVIRAPFYVVAALRAVLNVITRSDARRVLMT